MALAAPFPPWLNIKPETFTGAMESGGRLGVMALAQDVKAQQAADRLQLAYEGLEQRERSAAEALQGKLALGQQQMQFKQDALDQREQMQQQSLQERIAHNLGMEGLGRDRLKLAEETARARLRGEGARAASVSDWQKLLNDLHRANQTGNQYDKEVLLQALQGRLLNTDPTLKLRISDILRRVRESRNIQKGGSMVEPEIKLQYRRDEQKALQELEDLIKSKAPYLGEEGTPVSSVDNSAEGGLAAAPFPEEPLRFPWEEYQPKEATPKLAQAATKQ